MPKTWKKSFAENRPDLIQYIEPEYNNGKTAHEFGSASRGEITLVCPKCKTTKSEKIVMYAAKRKDGKWRAGFTCVYCNSFGVISNHLLKEWNDKNTLNPYEILAHSAKKAWWICSKGHEWEALIYDRSNGKNCSVCKASKGEKIVAEFLAENNIQYEAQYHATVNGIKRFFDFYIPEEKIFVEVHGKQHFDSYKGFYGSDVKIQQEIDRQKQEYAEANGVYIMVDYREDKPELALERFINAMAKLP